MRCVDHIDQDKKLGYMAWMVKANESRAKGQKQERCTECQRWFWPWEKRVLDAR